MLPAWYRATWGGLIVFHWAPTLGGDCYTLKDAIKEATQFLDFRFNGHPPLGVNATALERDFERAGSERVFQWAPTLGGECYGWLQEEIARFTKKMQFQWAPTLGGECYSAQSSWNRMR